MDTCVACGAELGVGRFCLNCGHRIGAPAPARVEQAPSPIVTATAPVSERPAPVEAPPQVSDAPAESPADSASADSANSAGSAVDPSADPSGDDGPAPGADSSPAPVVPPVQAADPTPVPPTSAPEVVPDDPHAPSPPRPTWDPREDLLPYEEVDDVDGDLPVRGMAWLGWVLGAALLVGLAFLLLRVFETDGDEVATDPADAATGTSQAPDAGAEPTGNGGGGGGDTDGDDDGDGDGDDAAPTGVGKARDLTRGATFEVPDTAPATTDFDGNLVAYEASQMGDRNPATAWRTAGDATGATITVTLDEPGVITRVGLINGYAKQVAGVDWYPNNRRILSVTWGFDNGSSIEQTFAERPDMQWLKVPPGETASVRITIDAVSPPGPGNLGRDYTAISEVGIMGRRAG